MPLTFGNISMPGGALFVFTSESIEADIAFAHAEFLKAKFITDRIPLNDLALKEIEKAADEKAKQVVQQMKLLGVSDRLKQLFVIKKKKEVQRFCKSFTVEERDLTGLIFNSADVGFTHSRQHFQIIPDSVKPNKEEETAFLSNGVGVFKSVAAKKFAKKIQAIFQVRKNINAHRFVRGNEWHIFWFTYDDINAASKGSASHWAGGDHIHYTSYLWGHNKDKVWSDLASGKYSVAGEHIKYAKNEDLKAN